MTGRPHSAEGDPTEPSLTASLERVDFGRRETVSTEIARRLLTYLLAGHIEPGQKIPSERKLAEALGVGRSIVREALKSLTLLGLVEVRQGDGTYLRSRESDLLPQSIEWGLLLGEKRIRDLVEARRYLEVIIAELAAERRDKDDIAALHGLLDEMRAAAGDPDRFVAADVAFHFRVTQAGRNESLHQIMTSIRALLNVWISRVMHAEGTYEPSMKEHVAVLKAIERGDPAASRAAMQRHMDGAFRRLEATIRADEARLADVAREAAATRT